MAEAFAKPDSLPFISHYVQRRRKKRKSSLPALVQRYFTDLTAADGQYYRWSSNPAISRLVFDVYSPTGSTTGLPAGTPAITANELQTLDFSYSGTLPNLGFDGVNYFDGIIANIKAYDLSSNLIVDCPVNEDWTQGNVAVNRADPSNNATAENITSADAELFIQDSDGDWLGEELWVNGETGVIAPLTNVVGTANMRVGFRYMFGNASSQDIRANNGVGWAVSPNTNFVLQSGQTQTQVRNISSSDPALSFLPSFRRLLQTA